MLIACNGVNSDYIPIASVGFPPLRADRKLIQPAPPTKNQNDPGPYMFEKILIAIDFSENTQKILEYTGGIPGVKEIVLLHVFDATHASVHGWIYGPAIENTQILMDEKKKFLESRGYLVTATVEVLTGGEVSREILRCAEGRGVSLIVIGARGKSLINDILLGSVSQNILRRAKTSVLIFPATMIKELSVPGCGSVCPDIFSTVLLPTDTSPHSNSVALWAKGIRGIGEVILLNVVDRGETEREIKDFEHEAQKKLDYIAQDIIAAGFAVKTQIRVGDRADMILSAVESDDASVIFMSPHGSGGFMGLYIGSTTLEVVKRAKRPVMVVR